ncbi:MAG: MMPL family transporter [Nitrososphaerota archaeon]
MELFLARWGRFVARFPLVILAAWIVLVVAAFHFGPSLQSVAEAQNIQTLPSAAPSVRAGHLYRTGFADGQRQSAGEADLLVLTDSQGISSEDIALAERLEAWLIAPATRPAHLVSVTGPGPQTPATAFESSDHQALRMLVSWDTANTTALQKSVDTIDAHLAQERLPTDVTVGLNGSSAFNRDFLEMIFGSAGLGVLLGVIIILLVLGFVYRSPLAVVVPLVSTGFAFALSVPVIAWLGQTFGLPVATYSLEYVAFVLLGAGTNYGVFMLSRYREEIQRGTDAGKTGRQHALGRAVGRVGESISSSAATVIAATAIMGLAQLALLRVTGPAVAIAVCCLLLAGLTLLPALMALCGKALFWPVRPRAGSLRAEGIPQRGVWAAAGRLVTRRPALVAGVTLLLLAPLAISTLSAVPSFDFLRTIPSNAPSVRAFRAYQKHFGDTASIDLFVSAPGHDLRQGEYAAALTNLVARLATVPHITHVLAPTPAMLPAQQAQLFATDGSAVHMTLDLAVDPESQDAIQTVEATYTTAAAAEQGTPLAGATVLLGGDAASVRDQAIQLGADFRLIITLVCLAIYAILALLVRSLTAPIYLLGTIALSAGTALGVTNLIFHAIFGQPLFYLVPVLAFVFLVALGEDFNILTMARIREEIGQFGHHQGIAAAVALTGGVVSSCGLVMAASFARMMTNPVLEIAETGFAILFGVLVDTFIVRPLLVPAIVTLLGRWNWVWPGRRIANVAKAVIAATPLEA